MSPIRAGSAAPSSSIMLGLSGHRADAAQTPQLSDRDFPQVMGQ